jgi:murein DD-endopeptidase MepM/ murein hydrolase activator NlpD
MAGRRRTFPLLLCCALIPILLSTGAGVPPASAAGPPTSQQVRNAKQHVRALQADIERARRQLTALQAKVGVATEAFLQAQDDYEQVTVQYLAVQERLRETTARFAEITARLNERAHAAFISGPGSGLEFILGSTSLADLSDRMEFIDAVAQTDVDLALQVQTAKDQLDAQRVELGQLRDQMRAAYLKKKQEEQQLQANLDAQQRLLDHIHTQLEDAKRYADRVSAAYQRWLRAQAQPAAGPGILKVCPVGEPRAFGDDFGAPRFSGGFHHHQGNDIIAPTDTPIYAPFAGVAAKAPNALGGLAVTVTGSLGYVYNAHLDHYAEHSTGAVQAGTVIGYVGTTGDAQGGVPHDHFEWHPNTVPSNWPSSSYGYSVIDGAVNPYPLLVRACL